MNTIEKVFKDILNKGASYVVFNITNEGITYTSDSGIRKSTKNIKVPKKEITEMERVLKSFDEKTVLFSGQIAKIEFTLLDGRKAFFERKNEKDFSHIIAKKVTETKSKEFIFFKVDTDKASIAFAIKDNKGKKQIDICKGTLMNGIFSTELDTDIQFVFSTELVVKKTTTTDAFLTEKPDKLEDLLAVYKKALLAISASQLIGMPLYSCLPSGLDDIDSVLDRALIETHTEVFNEAIMYRTQITKDGGRRLVRKNKIVMGTHEVMDLFPPLLFERIFGGNRYWIEDYEVGSRAEFFLQNMNITWFDRERFINELFNPNNYIELQNLLEEQSDKWLRKFYVFCAKEIHDQDTRIRMIAGYKNIKSIRDSKGKMQYPNKVTIPTGENDAFKKASILKEAILMPYNKKDEFTEKLVNFFRKEIGINSFSVKDELERLVKDMESQKPPINEHYCRTLLQMAEYDKSNPGEIDFKRFCIFPYYGSRGISRGKAKDILIGKPYIKEGDLLSRTINKPCLWRDFGKYYSEEELVLILEFIENCGAIGKPKVVKVPAAYNVNFNKRLKADGKRTYRDTDYDYTIPYLDELLKKQSLQISRLVWEAILKSDTSESVLYAEYSYNNREIVNRCDSSLIQILRQRTWVPNGENKFFKPEDIRIKDIKSDFIYNNRNAVLKSLSFGAAFKKKNQNRKNLEKLAKCEGFALIPLEEYKEYIDWKTKQAIK